MLSLALRKDLRKLKMGHFLDQVLTILAQELLKVMYHLQSSQKIRQDTDTSTKIQPATLVQVHILTNLHQLKAAIGTELGERLRQIRGKRYSTK